MRVPTSTFSGALRSIEGKFVVSDFVSRWECGNPCDVPLLAGMLIHYSHLLFGLSTVFDKLLSLSNINSSFATAAVKFICMWSVSLFLNTSQLNIRRSISQL
jgi:hypothetical protein